MRTLQQPPAIGDPLRQDRVAHAWKNWLLPIGRLATRVAVLLLAIFPCTARGGDCVDYGQYVHLVGISGASGCTDVVLAPPYAYVADGSSGVRIIRVNVPTAPVEVRVFNTPGITNGVAVTATHLFIADGAAGLQIATLANPTNPAIVGTANTPGNAWDVVVSGTKAYIADGTSGLTIVDISNPASPAILGSVSAPSSQTRKLAVSGNYAYLAYSSGGFLVVDVSNPSSPVIVATVPMYAVAVALDGDYAYVNDFFGSGLVVVDISNPTLPVIVGTAPITGDGVSVAGTHAYVASGTGGVYVVDISNRTSPVIVGRFETADAARDVAVSGSYAYIADLRRFCVADISNPMSPPTTAEISEMGEIRSVATAGPYAYATNGESLHVINISNPASPQVVGTLPLEFCDSIVVTGSYAYVTAAATEENLYIVDISNPISPVLVSTSTLQWPVNAIAVSGSYLYAASAWNGLRVTDISNPTSPVFVGSIVPPGDDAEDVAVDGQYAYVAYGTSGLRIVDVSNPASPVVVSTLPTDRSIIGVAIAGTQAYISGYDELEAHFLRVSVANPALPVVTGVVVTAVSFGDIVLAGEVAYLESRAVLAVDLSHLTLLGTAGSVRDANQVAVSGNHILVATESFLILPGHCSAATAVDLPEIAPVTTSRLAQNHPNPFDPAGGPTDISFTLSGATRASLQMFDVNGRRVRLLVDQVVAAGEHEARWDGRNDHGEPVASGVYFYRLEAGEVSETRTLVKLR